METTNIDQWCAAKGDAIHYERHVNVYPINENETSIDTMRSWVNKAQKFRSNAKDVKQQDIRIFGNMRWVKKCLSW